MAGDIVSLIVRLVSKSFLKSGVGVVWYGKEKGSMRAPMLMYLALFLIVIGITLGIYYLIPGFHHFLVFSLKGPGVTDPTQTRPLHAIAGFFLAILGALLLAYTRPKKAV
jgi:hypothetical protein